MEALTAGRWRHAQNWGYSNNVPHNPRGYNWGFSKVWHMSGGRQMATRAKLGESKSVAHNRRALAILGVLESCGTQPARTEGTRKVWQTAERARQRMRRGNVKVRRLINSVGVHFGVRAL